MEIETGGKKPENFTQKFVRQLNWYFLKRTKIKGYGTFHWRNSRMLHKDIKKV